MTCNGCGACCRSYTTAWVYLDPEEAVALGDLANGRYMKMIKVGPLYQCVALAGEIGKGAHCSIYERRPRTCRVFKEGGMDCAGIRVTVGTKLD